jgi:hypothetical protein
MFMHTGKLVDALPADDIVDRDALIELLIQSKTHQYQYVRRNADKQIEKKERERSIRSDGTPSPTKENQQFQKKLLGNTEAACLLVAATPHVRRSVQAAFVRLNPATMFDMIEVCAVAHVVLIV